MLLQAALTKRITNKARLEEVACQVIASSTDKLFEVGLDEHKVTLLLRLTAFPTLPVLHTDSRLADTA